MSNNLNNLTFWNLDF